MTTPEKSLKHLISDETSRAETAENQLSTEISTASLQFSESIQVIESDIQQINLDVLNEKTRAETVENQLSTSITTAETAILSNENNLVFCETFEFDGQIQAHTAPFSCGAGISDSSVDFGIGIPFKYKVVGFSACAKNSVIDPYNTVLIKLGVHCNATNGAELGELEFHLKRDDPNALVYYLLDTSKTVEAGAGILSLTVRDIYDSGNSVQTCGDQYSKYRVTLFIKRVVEAV